LPDPEQVIEDRERRERLTRLLATEGWADVMDQVCNILLTADNQSLWPDASDGFRAHAAGQVFALRQLIGSVYDRAGIPSPWDEQRLALFGRRRRSEHANDPAPDQRIVPRPLPVQAYRGGSVV
jgi:hypothetical protein